MKWLSNLFPKQSRESEMECTAHGCINAIINNPNEYSPAEQLRISREVLEKVRMTLEHEHFELLNEVGVYEKALGL
nr:hypothetical protein [uncultured Allomuricauda sp.]